MRIKFEHGLFDDCSCKLEVNYELFTEDLAKLIVNFWYEKIPSWAETWHEAALKIIAMHCIELATEHNCNKDYVIYRFESGWEEGFPAEIVSGKLGLTLVEVDGYQFSLDELDMITED